MASHDASEEPARSTGPRWVRVSAWGPAAFAGVAAIASIWGAVATQKAANIESTALRVETQAALVETCGTATPALFAIGDDFVVLTGSNGNDDYWNSVEPSDFNEQRPKIPHLFVRCQFTNLSRVPLLSIYVYYRLGFHHDKTVKTKHNLPFALAVGATHTIWFFNTDAQTVVFVTPEHARYIRFPNDSGLEDHSFRPRIHDFWILYRNHDPDERLDESVM
jgi:hypothetical protein